MFVTCLRLKCIQQLMFVHLRSLTLYFSSHEFDSLTLRSRSSNTYVSRSSLSRVHFSHIKCPPPISYRSAHLSRLALYICNPVSLRVCTPPSPSVHRWSHSCAPLSFTHSRSLLFVSSLHSYSHVHDPSGSNMSRCSICDLTMTWIRLSVSSFN